MTEEHGSFGNYCASTSGIRRLCLPSAKEMAALDQETIANGVSGGELMERAGRAVAEHLLRTIEVDSRVVVLCGPGNNGGDGLVIARSLLQHGCCVSTVLVAATRYSSECLAQIRQTPDVSMLWGRNSDIVCPLVGLPAVTFDELSDRISASTVVIDALLGTGQRDAPHGVIAEVVQLLQDKSVGGWHRELVSVDIPTGINADTGSVYSPHIVASRTIAIQCIKRGLLQFPARSACGVVEAVDVGIAGVSPVEYSLVTRDSIPQISQRLVDTHKGMLGRVLVVGGSVSMPGAPALAALGALRTGAGIVSRCGYERWLSMVPIAEAMFEILPGDDSQYSSGSVARVTEMLGRYDVCVLGPGMTTESGAVDFVIELLESARSLATRFVLDADALNALAERSYSLEGLQAIITPHPGEAGRLLGVSTAEIQSDRFRAARELSKKLRAVTVLKGAGSLVYDGSTGDLIADGTPYLATPGSGDVLAGVIAACVPRTHSLREAATLGVWLHARAGVAAAKERQGPVIASDIAAHVSSVVGPLERVSSRHG